MELATRRRVGKLLPACEVAFMVVGSHAAHYAFSGWEEMQGSQDNWIYGVPWKSDPHKVHPRHSTSIDYSVCLA